MRLVLWFVISMGLIGCSQFDRRPASVRSVPKGLPKNFSIDWPVDKARLTQKFKPKGSKRHWGLDLAGKRGTPILASHQGKVIYAGSGFRGYGNLVIVEYGDLWASFYSHLDKITVKQGDWVRQGHMVGRMGDTGRATGTHLHFELRKKRKPVDPLAYLP